MRDWRESGLMCELSLSRFLFSRHLERDAANLWSRPQRWRSSTAMADRKRLPALASGVQWAEASNWIASAPLRKYAFIFHALPSEYLTRCLFLMDSPQQWGAWLNLWGERTWNTKPVLWFRAPPPRRQRFGWFFSSASERFASNDTKNTAS